MQVLIEGFIPPPIIETYPVLKRSNRGCVILFTSEKAGTVLISGDSPYDVGEVVGNLHEGVYTVLPVTAKVTLSNEGLL